MNKKYRNLTSAEVDRLEARGCVCGQWDKIKVSDGFSADYVRGVRFSGDIWLGANGKTTINTDGVERRAGIYNAELIDCTVGDNVFISNIGIYISRYDIGDDACIEGTGKIVCTGTSRFGNGVEVAAVNEAGGREVPIFDGLSSQTAYILAMYRHRTKMVDRLRKMINDYSEEIDKARGAIGKGARISGADTLHDVHVGEHAVIENTSVLANGTVNSCKESPAYIGAGVTAHDFICAYGAKIDNGAKLLRCFVGEASKIDYGFTATDSLFFSNCDCANGEACSVFAGPFTVSHHKSSLLIAGYFLFFNAGSGANQSNNLFKTGAVHQGVHERGCKFASNAYAMLPAREGAFTVVLGRHRSHHDTADFPYSYLTEENGRSYLIPGANLRSYGTMRDLEKWGKRDMRGPARCDIVNFEEHNPYIGMKLFRALAESRKMLLREEVDTYNFHGARIKESMLKRGIRLYQMSLEATIGDILANGYITEKLGDLHWVDAAGMFIPHRDIESIIEHIESGKAGSLKQVQEEFTAVGASYKDATYSWALLALKELLGHDPSGKDIEEAISKGKESKELILSMRKEDGKRDSDESMAVSYGIDALSKEEVTADFKATRKFE